MIINFYNVDIMEYTKDEIVNGIKSQIKANDNKAIHALMTIYSCQTDSEQNFGNVIITNGSGFGRTDAELLSSFAKQYDEKGWLSDKQLSFVKRLMPKYAGQLFRISYANGNFEEVKVLNEKTNRPITKYRISKK